MNLIGERAVENCGALEIFCEQNKKRSHGSMRTLKIILVKNYLARDFARADFFLAALFL